MLLIFDMFNQNFNFLHELNHYCFSQVNVISLDKSIFNAKMKQRPGNGQVL